MSCEDFQKLIPDYLADALNKKETLEFNLHAKECMNCKKELSEMQTVWKQLGKMPAVQPSENITVRFERMLNSFKEEEKGKAVYSIKEKIKNVWENILVSQPVWQIAGILVVLSIGFIGGYYFSSAKISQKEFATLHAEVSDMRQLVSLSLLKQNSPGDRLQGIHWSQSVKKLNPQLFSALINTMNNDPNVNVRLAAVNSLYLFSDQVDVRTELVASLAIQNSPLVQISLINLLVEIRERKALDALNMLLKDNMINDTVKEQVQRGVRQLESL